MIEEKDSFTLFMRQKNPTSAGVTEVVNSFLFPFFFVVRESHRDPDQCLP